ncbi:MAG TPA: elongation factor P hydroxylase, partial [Pantoea sp.]|nr:elongation factor P hydroxylase [Pantoea sp.]
RFITALAKFYGRPSLTASQFPWPDDL